MSSANRCGRLPSAAALTCCLGFRPKTLNPQQVWALAICCCNDEWHVVPEVWELQGAPLLCEVCWSSLLPSHCLALIHADGC
jgi:hypothetical protein